MLPVVLTEYRHILHQSGRYAQPITGRGRNQGGVPTVDCRWIEDGQMSAGSVLRPVLNLLGSLNLNQWTGLFREARSRLPAVRRSEFGAYFAHGGSDAQCGLHQMTNLQWPCQFHLANPVQRAADAAAALAAIGISTEHTWLDASAQVR
jgi:hypothetical protein